jgi:DNA-3-methyladenine glycosylase
MDQVLGQSAELVAKRILGWKLIRQIGDKQLIGRIVETECYDQTDAASHSYRGVTPRTKVMFGPSGFAYIYFTYGMHYCMNIVTGKVGEGSAVLVRALEPIEGIEYMRILRKQANIVHLANGPAKLCQALKITRDLNGHDLSKPPLQLVVGETVSAEDIVTTTRIGISQNTDRPWRFYIKGNNFVSKP